MKMKMVDGERERCSGPSSPLEGEDRKTWAYVSKPLVFLGEGFINQIFLNNPSPVKSKRLAKAKRKILRPPPGRGGE
jgi:hypothetical protein